MFSAFGSNLGETDDHGAAVHDEELSWFDVSQDDALSESESEGEHEEDDGRGSSSSLTESLCNWAVNYGVSLVGLTALLS